MIQIAYRSITTGEMHNWRVEPVTTAPATAKVFPSYAEAAAHMKARLEKVIAANKRSVTRHASVEAELHTATRKLAALEAAPVATCELPRFIVTTSSPHGGFKIEQVTYVMTRANRVYYVRGDEMICELEYRAKAMFATFAEAKDHALELAQRRVSDAQFALGTAEAIRDEVEALTPNA